MPAKRYLGFVLQTRNGHSVHDASGKNRPTPRSGKAIARLRREASLARPNKARSVIIAANSPRVGIEGQVRRLLILLMKRIYGSFASRQLFVCVEFSIDVNG